MTKEDKNRLGKTLWDIASKYLRGGMNADDFRDYMLSFLFLRYLSSNYEKAAKEELGSDYPVIEEADKSTKKGEKPEEKEFNNPLLKWYKENPDDVAEFEEMMKRNAHYVITPEYLWSNILELALQKNADSDLLKVLDKGFDYIETESFDSTFQGLFSEINLSSDKLGKDYGERNLLISNIIVDINDVAEFDKGADILGDAYEYLIGQFAAGSGKKAGEFYTPQPISSILSGIVTLDGQNPATGSKKHFDKVLDFACGSGSLLLNVRHKVVGKDGKQGTIGKIYGGEKNITTYNLARMNMLLHGVKDSEFDIHHGDSLLNDWDILNEQNPAKKVSFDAIVANPPFSLKWDPSDAMAQDFRFKGYGVAPKSAADFAFLLHGFHFLAPEGVMAIVLPHGVLFRGGAEERIRTKLLKGDGENGGYIDTVIGLPSNLFYNTGIPVCIIVLKKCKRTKDVLFINASEHYAKEKRQNRLREGENGEPNDIEKIIETYKHRTEEDRYSRVVQMDEIERKGFNLNISRYVSTAVEDTEINLNEVNTKLLALEEKIFDTSVRHNKFLAELGLPLITKAKDEELKK
jgi:type I restriction enzyme M protein